MLSSIHRLDKKVSQRNLTHVMEAHDMETHVMGPMTTDSIKRSWSPRATFAAGDSGVGGRKGMSKTSIVSRLITLVTPLPSHTYNMSTHRSEGAFKLGSFHPNHWTASFFPIYIHIYAHFNIYYITISLMASWLTRIVLADWKLANSPSLTPPFKVFSPSSMDSYLYLKLEEHWLNRL